MNKDYSLPVNWFWVKLGDVGEVVAGGTPSTKVHEYFDGEIAWITPADLTGYRNKYISKGRRNISEEGLKNSSARLVPKDSILFSFRAPIGYVVIAANEISTNQGFKNLLPNKKVDSEFVYYYLKSAKRLAEENASGTTFKEISAKNFSRLPIPLPPLPEQKKIVEKIEELFSGLDSGVASLKKAKEQLWLYRQSVLASAFNGRSDGGSQKSNVKSQKEMLKAAEPEVKYKNNGLPESWKWVKLGEVCGIEMGQSPPSSTYNTDKIGLPFFQGKAEFTEFHPEVRKWCSKPKKIAEPFDILLSVRAPVGSTNIANQKCCIGRGLAAIRYPNCYKYIFYHLRFIENKLDELGTGSTFKAISSITLRNVKIPLPPLSEQSQIVEEIESRFAGSEALEKAIDDSLTKAETLRQSILKRAFEGKLV